MSYSCSDHRFNMTPFFVFLLFFSTTLVQSDNYLNCQDLTSRNTTKFEIGEFVILQVIVRPNIWSYRVTGPIPLLSCDQQFDLIERNSSSGSCQVLRCDNATIVAVVIRMFKRHHAGIWRFTINFSGHGAEEHQIQVYGTEYDERFHNKTIEVRNGEYIVMTFKEVENRNMNCKLINEGTNERYNLSDVEFRFPENEANFWTVDQCGFHIPVGIETQGNWSLIRESGWNIDKAHFEVRINSTIFHKDVSPREGYHLAEYMMNVVWFEGFKGIFPVGRSLFDMEEFLELENPSKDIIRPSDMARDFINVGYISIEDNGIWKFRAGKAHNLGILTERDFSIGIKAFPPIFLDWDYDHKNQHHFPSVRVISIHPQNFPTTCTLKYGNEPSPNCEIEKNEFKKQYTIRLVEGTNETTNNTKIWELSMDHGILRLNVVIVSRESSSIQYVWHSRQMQKYVNRGETLKVRCPTYSDSHSALKKCSLVSPQGTIYFRRNSSFVSDLDGSDKNRTCGCMVTIVDVKDEHNGTWTCRMDYEDGPELESSVPVRVTESDLIPEVEQTNNINGTVYLQCQLSPGKRYRKIVLCEWSHGDDSMQGDSTDYTVWKEDRNCSLEIKNPSEKDVGNWKCSVRLDLGGKRNITIEFQKIFIKGELNEKHEIGQLRFTITEHMIAIQLPFDCIYVFLMSAIGVICVYILFKNHKPNHYRKIQNF